MPERKKRRNSKASGGSLTRSISLLRSEVRLGQQELHTRLDKLENKIDTRFDQIYRHIDGFVKLHETLDIEMKVLTEQMKRLEERVERLEAS
jgi:chaperonin cofactor prefoldin